MVQEEGCQPNVVTYNTLIDVYGKMGCWQEAVQVLDDMTAKVLSLHIFCRQRCWVKTPESVCNVSEACTGSAHATVAEYITAAIKSIVGGLLGWWVMVNMQIITPGVIHAVLAPSDGGGSPPHAVKSMYDP